MCGRERFGLSGEWRQAPAQALSLIHILMSPNGGGRPVLAAPKAHNIFSVSSCGDRYIVFDSIRDGKQLLWRTDADGSNGMQLADEAGFSDCSPDGKWVFYVAKRHVYRMSVEGGTPSQVMTAQTGGELDVSPDGNLVAVRYQEEMCIRDRLGLGTEDFQVREEHCVIADLVGKGKHILPFRFRSGRNALSMSGPRPLASNVGAVFRRVSRMDDIWGDSITPKAIWAASRNSATR